MRKQPTILETARAGEGLAKQAMEKAKESFRVAHAAYDAIAVTVAQLEAAEDDKTKGVAEMLARTCSIAPTCANWIGFCRQIGWPEESVAALEGLWEKYHEVQPST